MSIKGFSTLNKILGKKKDKNEQKSTTNKVISSSQSQQDNCIIQLPVATSTTPFEQTFRITVLLPRDQLYVTRLGAKVKLEKLLDLVCEDKLLDCELYEFRHPIDISQVFNLESTIGTVGLTELRLCNKSETYDNFNADEIIKMRHQTIERDSLSSSEFSAKKSHNMLKTASPYSSTNSLNSMDSTGMNTNYRAPIKIPLQTNEKQQPPIPPARKKRKAPLPPIPPKIYENQVTDSLENFENEQEERTFNGFKKPLNKKNFHESTPNINNGLALQAGEFNYSNLSINCTGTALMNGKKSSDVELSTKRSLSIQYDNSVVSNNQQRLSNNSNISSEESTNFNEFETPIYSEVSPRKKSAPLPPPRIINKPVASPRKISTIQLNDINGNNPQENHTSITQLNSATEYSISNQFKDLPVSIDFKTDKNMLQINSYVGQPPSTTTSQVNGHNDKESTNGSVQTSSKTELSEGMVIDELESITKLETSIISDDIEVTQEEHKISSKIDELHCTLITETAATLTALRPKSPEPVLIPAPDNFADNNLKVKLELRDKIMKNEITNTEVNEFKSDIKIETNNNIDNVPHSVSDSDQFFDNCKTNIQNELIENKKKHQIEISLSINKPYEEDMCDFILKKPDIKSETNLNQESIKTTEAENKKLQPSTAIRNLSNFKISTYRPLSVTVKTFSEENDIEQIHRTGEDKVYVKKLNMITLQKDPCKRKNNISRSDSFHSTRYINDISENHLSLRSSSVLSLIANQNLSFQEVNKSNSKSSNQLSISDSPSLQSLIVMKSILNSRKNSITSAEKNNSFPHITGITLDNNVVLNSGNSSPQDEPAKIWIYHGPPSINLSTWSERPKVQPVTIKNEGDYIIGNGPSPLNTPTSIVKRDYRKSMPPILFTYQDNNNAGCKFSSIPYEKSYGNSLSRFRNTTNNGIIYRQFNEPPSEEINKSVTTYNSIQTVINKANLKDPWKINSTKSLDRCKLKPKPQRYSHYDEFDNRLNKKAEELIPAFAQITLRKTGLKEKICAVNSILNIVELESKTNECNECKEKLNNNIKLEVNIKPETPQNRLSPKKSGLVQPPPPPPPIIRSVVTKHNSANLIVNPRDQLLSAIRNFNPNSLKQM